jgi:hypothetical protein
LTTGNSGSAMGVMKMTKAAMPDGRAIFILATTRQQAGAVSRQPPREQI